MTTDNKLADAIAARDAAIQQAQIWKMEAQTANATIAEIYRLVGSKAGNWNGAKPVREAIAAPPAQEPVAEVTEGGYMERSIVWLEAAADLPAGVHKLYTATPALPEVTDEDEAAAWDVLLITTDSCAGGDMRKVLESYRARLMAKAVPNG